MDFYTALVLITSPFLLMIFAIWIVGKVKEGNIEGIFCNAPSTPPFPLVCGFFGVVLLVTGLCNLMLPH